MAGQSDPIVAFLLDPASYQDGTSNVELIETHISWVFLTDRFVYKLKKPVRFDFLDFSTGVLRRHACDEEVRLNGRLAPTVYLGVLPLSRQEDGTFAIDGDGEVFEWVVKMRRLRAEQAMDVAIAHHRLTAEQQQTIADTLVAFHAKLAPDPIPAEEYLEGLERHIQENLAAMLELHPEAASQLRAIHSRQLCYLHTQREVLAERVAAGRVVDGHGDLRPEHIYLETPPVVIDCIEFSPELRRVDVADEISFLAMECERLGLAGFGDILKRTYQQQMRDQLPEQLLSFYRCYRACVRAKVAMLRERQLAEAGRSPDQQSTAQYLQLATTHADRVGPPCMIVVGGMIGTGKSTLANQIARDLGAELIATDAVRQEQLGPSTAPADYGQGHYRPERRAEIYQRVLERAQKTLQQRRSVVLDGTYLGAEQRQDTLNAAARLGAAHLLVLCECDRATSVARIRQREAAGGSASEARIELYDRLLEEFDPPAEEEQLVRILTTHDLADQSRAVYATLGRVLATIAAERDLSPHRSAVVD